jgi:phosphopantothenoylcysteine decarboxylase/phosphopantothenate--cysteine ligase
MGVTGGIAAYKAAEIVRRLKSAGAEVRVVLTRGAHSFVSPLTLEVLSGQAVYGEEYLEPNGTGEELHITAAVWADVLCVAPATAHCLARLALGLADDFLTTTALAFSGPLVIAPAMHFEMWGKPAVQQHVATLEARGARLIGPIEGPLASGEIGMGRMADPERIVLELLAIAGGTPGPLAGRTVLISAGPTFEPVDPVRFLGNRSSGKMGFAIAAEAARRGARTILIAGPVALATPAGVERIDVETAAEMAAAVAATAPGADLVILAAAVADFRPKALAGQKIKKDQGVPTFDLEPTEDILAGLFRIAPNAVRVGFAAETERLVENARAKLLKKDVHFIVANDVSRSDIAFGRDENEVLVLARDGDQMAIPRQSKTGVAAALLDLFTAALATPTEIAATAAAIRR